MKAFALEPWRRDYIASELLQNGFFNDPSSLCNIVVDEVGYALFSPPHEKQHATYGAFIAKAVTDWDAPLRDEFNGEFTDCSEMSRYCADGIHSYIVRSASEFRILRCGKDLSFRTQARLFLLRDHLILSGGSSPANTSPILGERDLIIVRRDELGDVTVIHWNGITRCTNGRWAFTPNQYNLLLEENIVIRGGIFNKRQVSVLRYILNMCLNILSPAGYGATIVMHLESDTHLLTNVSNKNALHNVPPFEVCTLGYQFSIAHILSQCDGAAIISDKGVFKQAGLWLTPRADLLFELRSTGGSRQLTARAISSVIESPIITVSCDGPVRAYYKGEIMFDTSSQIIPKLSVEPMLPEHSDKS